MLLTVYMAAALVVVEAVGLGWGGGMQHGRPTATIRSRCSGGDGTL